MVTTVPTRKTTRYEPGGHGATFPLRTWRCEHCHGMLHAGRGQTPEAVAAVHDASCPALLRPRTR